MAVTPPDIKMSVTTNDACTTLTFEDTTGAYDAVTNPHGWGAPGQPAITDVKSITLTLVNETNSTTVVYTIACNAGVITDCHVSIDGGASQEITSQLPALTLPLDSTNPFDLLGSYGIDMPSLEDGVWRTYYAVTGTYDNGSGVIQNWNYTVQTANTVDCSVCCCVSKMFQAIDANCGCEDKSWLKAMRARAYQLAAVYITDATGDVEKAVANLNMAQDICEGNCGCGC